MRHISEITREIEENDKAEITNFYTISQIKKRYF